MKIHTGDTVIIITGKDKGKQGTVMRVLDTQNRVVVEGINMRIRHIKKTPNQAGSRVSYEASIHASNVMILDPKTKKPTRVGFTVDEKTGKKSRFAKVSGEVIAKTAVAKAKKTTAKDSIKESKESKESKEKKTEVTSAQPAAPAKTPFWKRGSKGKGGDEGADGASGDSGPNTIQTAHRAQGG